MKKQVTRQKIQQGVRPKQNQNLRRPPVAEPLTTGRPASQGKASQPFAKPRRGGSQPQASAAAAYASGQRASAPQFLARARDQVRIVHRELLGSITGSSAFTVAQTVALNPGIPASFPWLSSQAQSWERYRFNKLRFCYFTRTGSNVPGSAMLVPDYDASDPAPASEQIASTYEDVEEDAPWKDICCELRPQALHALGPTKFIRAGALLANQDIKTYDAGNFFMCTTDGTAVNWGKLWVEYDVTLFTPQLQPGGSGSLAYQRISGATPTTASMLGTQTQAASSTGNIVSVAGEIVTFNQAGTFLLSYFATATSDSVSSNPVTAAGGSQALLQQAGNTTAALSQTLVVTAVVGTTVTFNNTVVGGLTADLIVAQLPAASA